VVAPILYFRAMSENSAKSPLGLLFVAVLLGALDIAVLGPALPAIGKTFGQDPQALSWLFSLYVLANLIGTPLLSHLSDRYGRRVAFRLGVTLFGAGSLLLAASPWWEGLLVARLLQGLGAGGLFPVAAAVIGDTVEPEKRGRALGMIGATFGLAFLVGPLLGGVLMLWDWRLIFLLNLPVVLWLLVQSQRVPQREHAGKRPLLPLALARQPMVAIALVLGAVAGASESVLVHVPSLFVLRFGLEPAQASFSLMPVVLTLALGAPLVGRLLDRVGPRPVLLVGTLMAGLGMIAMGSGGIKPCVSAHVGDQFGARNAHLLSKIFNWFYFFTFFT